VNHLWNAAVANEVDELNRGRRTIIVSQPIQLGTGDVKLIKSLTQGRIESWIPTLHSGGASKDRKSPLGQHATED